MILRCISSDTLKSIFLHIIGFVALCLFQLFSNNAQTIKANNLQVSVVSSDVLKSYSKANNRSTAKTVAENHDFIPVAKEPLDSKDAEVIETKKVIPKNDLVVDKDKLKESNEDASKVNSNTENETKPLDSSKNKMNMEDKKQFASSILSGLVKDHLTDEELQAINSQIRSCWYGQNGYDSNDNIEVELVLTMNPDATIKEIQILNLDKYDTAVRQSLLNQAIRALHDPRCAQLRLPMGSYNKWRIIHLTFSRAG